MGDEAVIGSAWIEIKAKLDTLSQDLTGAEDKIAGFAKNAGKLLGVVSVAVIGKEIINLGKAWDQAKTDFAVNTGLMGIELTKYQGLIRELHGSTGLSLEESVDLITVLTNKLNLSAEQVKTQMGTWENFMDVFQATPETINNLEGALLKFGDTTWETKTKLMDMATVLRSETNMSMDDLVSNLAALAPQFNALKMDVPQATTFIGYLAKAGFDASEMALGLNTALQKIKTPQELYDIMQKIKDAPDYLEAAGIATDTFGGRAGAKMATALREGTVSIDEMTIALGRNENAFENAAKVNEESYQKKIDKLKNGLQEIGITIGEKLINAALPIVSWLSDTGIPAVSKFFDLFMRGLEAIPGPIGKVGFALAGLGIAFTVLKNLMVGHPLILLALTIAAVIAAIPLLVEAFTPLNKKLDEMRQASFEEAKASGAANAEKIAALERVKVLLDEAARLQSQDKTPETLGRLREIAAAINKEFPEAAATVDETTGQIKTTFGSGIDEMKGKVDELISKVREIQSAEQAQALAEIENAKGQLKYYDDLKTAADKQVASLHAAYDAAIQEYGDASIQANNALEAWKNAETAAGTATKAYEDQAVVLAGLEGTYAGVILNINAADFSRAITNIRALGLTWDEIKNKGDELIGATQTSVAGMVQALKDGGVPLNEAMTMVANDMVKALGISLGQAQVEVTTALFRARMAVIAQEEGGWSDAGATLGRAMGLGIASGISQTPVTVETPNASTPAPTLAGAIIGTPEYKPWESYGHASGGPVFPGIPAIVGEKGPELYMPRVAGDIIPFSSFSGSQGTGGSGFQTANIYVELDGRTIARAISAPLVKEIRLRSGVKY